MQTLVNKQYSDEGNTRVVHLMDNDPFQSVKYGITLVQRDETRPSHLPAVQICIPALFSQPKNYDSVAECIADQNAYFAKLVSVASEAYCVPVDENGNQVFNGPAADLSEQGDHLKPFHN